MYGQKFVFIRDEKKTLDEMNRIEADARELVRSQSYPTMEAFAEEAGDVPVVRVAGGLEFVLDENGPIEANGRQWRPGGVPDIRHFGAPLDGVSDDAPALQALIDYADAAGLKRITIGGAPTLHSTVFLKGGIDYLWDGWVTYLGSGNAFQIVDRAGGYERYGKFRGFRLRGNPAARCGLFLTNCQYWDWGDTVIENFTYEGTGIADADGVVDRGAWAVIETNTPDNRGSGRHMFGRLNWTNVANGWLKTKNAAIIGTANTGASHSTCLGGAIQYGTSARWMNYGCWWEVGEANEATKLRCSTSYEYTAGWHLADAKMVLDGCAGDGPVYSSFVYFLAGQVGGAITGIRLFPADDGTSTMLTTPVPWAGSPETMAQAVVDQIIADGRQYPATPYRALAYGPQVIFYRVDTATDREISFTSAETRLISVTHSGTRGFGQQIDFGDSSLTNGKLNGAPYDNYPGVTENAYGYRRGHGGSRETYGCIIAAGGGEIRAFEGNGPNEIITFTSPDVIGGWEVEQGNSRISAKRQLTKDPFAYNADDLARFYTNDPAKLVVTHRVQQFRLIQYGPFVHCNVYFAFTATTAINGADAYWELLPPLTLDRISKPNGTYDYVMPVLVTGLSHANVIGRNAYLTISNATGRQSPNGFPTARLSFSNNSVNTWLLSNHITVGTEVGITGNHMWPVQRFS